MVGCAAILGIIGFVIGFVVGLFVGGPSSPGSLMAGTLTGGIAFVAALLLFARDRCRHWFAVKQIHRRLLARPDLELDEFCKSFPLCNPVLLADIRDAIAAFFNVPPTKIHPTDHLQKDYSFNALEPGFHANVVYHVLARRKVPLGNFTFRKDFDDLGAFIGEVQNILNTLQSNYNGQEFSEK